MARLWVTKIERAASSLVFHLCITHTADLTAGARASGNSDADLVHSRMTQTWHTAHWMLGSPPCTHNTVLATEESSKRD